ncbi:NlpC/P60 family protein [Nocardioides mangrovicus]|uniref:NlpC/P60 family protein n=1 Tax=Nocardioides mangrovicus TaxID=2478913 RepID=A0A3L8P7A7_9ACTN|nr:C40 family peptidase [Nocardioides mangrovicus]RLV51014.1 NlpC/P60 family protein [Nocardioides mangrovicus]
MLSVSAEVATLWTAPDAPREVDAPAVADVPDLAAWTGALTPPERLGLHGRTLTQALRGEPAEVLEERGDWLQVALPWQPCVVGRAEPGGYVGWLRRAHLSPGSPRHRDEPGLPQPNPLDLAREHLGLPYLWAGTSPWGLDCSGLVHLTFRRLGVVVPRDSPDQQAAATPVDLDDVRPGDLYFFAHEDGRIYHVGFATSRCDPATGERRMLHAPEGDPTAHGHLEDAPMSARRHADLVAAGRVIPDDG